MQEPQEIGTTEKEENGDNKETTREANTLLEGLVSLSKELQSFKQDMRKDLGEFKKWRQQNYEARPGWV